MHFVSESIRKEPALSMILWWENGFDNLIYHFPIINYAEKSTRTDYTWIQRSQKRNLDVRQVQGLYIRNTHSFFFLYYTDSAGKRRYSWQLSGDFTEIVQGNGLWNQGPLFVTKSFILKDLCFFKFLESCYFKSVITVFPDCSLEFGKERSIYRDICFYLENLYSILARKGICRGKNRQAFYR